MKIKDCIQLAAETLNLDAYLGEEDTEKLLLRCANNCIDEIVSEYLPLKSEAKVTAKSGRIEYASFAETVFDIVYVRNNLGHNVKFELFPAHIKVREDGEYTVGYYTRPGTLGLEDDVPVSLRLTPRVVAYGIAAEYMLLSGFYEEAMMYDRRFKDALVRLAYGNGKKRVKGRRWLL